MRAPVRHRFRRSAVAVLASGVVISMSALTGGVAPAFAKPGDRSDPDIPVIPTLEVVVPEAPQVVSERQGPVEAPRARKEQPSAPRPQAPAPQIEAPPPQVQAPPPGPEAPAPQIQVPEPKKETPKVVEAPRVVEAAEAPEADPPTADVPQVDASKPNAPNADTPKIDSPPVDPPISDTPEIDASNADTPAALPAVGQPANPSDPMQDAQIPRSLLPGQKPDVDGSAPAEKQPPAADDTQSDSSPVSKAAQRIPTAQPAQMQASEQDIQLARQSKPVEVKPEPAKRDDVAFLSSAIDLESKTKLGPFESEFEVGSEFSVGDRRDHDRDWDWHDKHWDKKVRQWDKRWIEYDHWYRPVFCNPYRAPVRIVYIYERAPRILIVPALGRVVIDAAAVAAYSFTAVVLNAANLAADVAVGTFFGGGYIPPIGAPFVPPPPLLRYDNVPVQVRYSNATYQPFRVNQVVDVGDDVQYGGRKVLLDGATPAWGQWTTSPTGERQFEVHRTQQYPGLGEPQEAPLPGDYQMQLASEESANVDRSQMYLMAAAGVVAGLGFGALGLAVYLGRRRRVA